MDKKTSSASQEEKEINTEDDKPKPFGRRPGENGRPVEPEDEVDIIKKRNISENSFCTVDSGNMSFIGPERGGKSGRIFGQLMKLNKNRLKSRKGKRSDQRKS